MSVVCCQVELSASGYHSSGRVLSCAMCPMRGDREAILGEAMVRNRVEAKDFSQTATEEFSIGFSLSDKFFPETRHVMETDAYRTLHRGT